MGIGLNGGSIFKDWVYVNPVTFVRGRVGPRTELMPDGLHDRWPHQHLVAGAPLWFVYSLARLQWRLQGFRIHVFVYDWRKHAELAVAEFDAFVRARRAPGRPLAVVAHSMGGLIPLLWAADHADWRQHIERAVFLGVPVGGCMTGVQSYAGTYPFMASLTHWLPTNKLIDLRRAAASFPGMADMLPNPSLFDPSTAAIYANPSWRDGIGPSQTVLDHSLALKSRLLTSPLLSVTHALATDSIPTVESVDVVNGEVLPGNKTAPGDSVVPLYSAVAGGITGWLVGYSHSNLPLDPKVRRAVPEILRTGTCALPRV